MALEAILSGGYTGAVPTFGENLRRLRTARNPQVRQQELAARLKHKNNSTVSKWETEGVLPEPDTVEKVAAALGVKPWQLLDGVDTGYDRLRRGDPTRHGGTENGSSDVHSQGGPTNAEAATRAILAELQSSYEIFHDEVAALARQLKTVADRQPEIIRTGGPHNATPHRRRGGRPPRGTRRAG